jgi:hypothetical protein
MRRQNKRLVGRQLEVVFLELVPDGLVYALGIVPDRREQVDHQQMNALLDQGRGFFDEGTQLAVATFVAGRNNLDDGDDLAVSMSNGDPICLVTFYPL